MSTTQQLKSWKETLNELGPRQREVLVLLAEHPEGMSAWELSTALKRFVHAVRPRLTELRDMGLIRQVGERFENWTQRLEAKWGLANSNPQMEMFR